MKCFARLLLQAALLFFAFLPFDRAGAEELIRSFDSAVDLNRDGSMLVTETITVNAEGRDIRRGIFRDFPLTFTDAEGRTASVDFDLKSVERDGHPEPWHSESISGGTRIYIGDGNVLLDPGQYRFTITYRTNRQVRYFSDYDELSWNVTGNGWKFRILEASATIRLPDGAQAEDVASFTGVPGSRENNARAERGDGSVSFRTTRPLGIGEGLTVAVKLPKGALAAPSATQQNLWFLKDHSDVILGFGGLVLILIYYTRAWNAVGRDPARGVIVPRWDAPDGISPALVNYIDNRGFSGQGWAALSASALDLAVKGYVVLEDLESRIVIRRTAKPAAAGLESGQKALLDSIGGEGASLVIDKANGERVEQVGRKFRSAIEKEHRDEYYRKNMLYIVVGIALSVLTLAAIVLFGRLHEESVTLIIVPLFLSVLVSGFAAKAGRSFRPGGSLASRIVSVVFLGFVGVVCASVLSGLVAGMLATTQAADVLPLLVAIVAIFVTNILFFFLMGAPTPIGRRMMDGIDGLRQYLTLAEKDRMNMAGAPAMSPQHFETLLPYAVALGVEKPWSKTFERWLAAAAAGTAAAGYAPAWYVGNYGDFSDRVGGFSSSMASTIASTIPAPVSSSSSSFSGGGSSGGGGGGGGGGGW